MILSPRFVSLVCCLFCIAVQAQSIPKKNPLKSFRLNGKIDGLTNQKIYLQPADAPLELDSTYAKNGSFSFSGNIEEPVFYVLRVESLQSQATLFLEPGTITMKGHKDSIFKSVITGSKSMNEFREWSKTWTSIATQAGPMYKRLDSATNHGKVKEPESERKIFDDGMKYLGDLTDKAVTAFVTKYPESSVAPFIIYDRYIGYPNPDMAKATFALLGNKAKNSIYGKKTTHYQLVAAKTGIGATPDFTVADTSGKKFKLSSLKGKYVLVDFWASWCVPCRKENPNVVKAYQAYHDKGFEIVGVSLDTKKDAWQKAIAMDGLAWNHVSDLKGWESGIVQEFGITVVPTSFLVDPTGKVIANNLRAEALQKKLAELMK